MRYIPTLAFLIVFIDVFTKVLNKLTAGEATAGHWIVGIAVAVLLSVTAAEIAFVIANKGVTVYRWLRLKTKRR